MTVFNLIQVKCARCERQGLSMMSPRVPVEDEAWQWLESHTRHFHQTNVMEYFTRYIAGATTSSWRTA